jgi:uncharacterized protein (TIGR02996 family)
MTDRRAFLDAIIENPDDDTVRLVYADWLDEHGSEANRARARLIRLQIELHRDEDDDRRPALLRECDVLFESHLKEWMHGFTYYTSFRERSDYCDFYKKSFSRGFLHGLPLLQQKDLSDPGLDALLTHEPVADFVMSVSTDEADEEISRWSHLPRVRRLEFFAPAPHRHKNSVKAILRSPLLSGLHHLDASWDVLDEEDVVLVASDERFAGLRGLNIRSNHVGDGAVEVVARSPILSRLAALGFGGGRTSATALAALAASPLAQRLTCLGFWRHGQAVGRRVGEVIAGFPCLEEIDLHQQEIGDEGAMSLAESPNMTGLKRLRLVWNRLRGGAVALLTSPHLIQLEELDLSANDLGGGWVDAFVAAGPRRLRKLVLNSARFDAEAIARLAEAPGLEGVRELCLRWNGRIGDQGVIALARSSRLRRQRKLDLRDCGIGDEGVSALADSPLLDSLEGRDGLRMRGNHYGPEAARRLEERLGYDPS